MTRILQLPDGQLAVERDGEKIAVTVRRCFPWSEPGRHFSLRNMEGDEVALVSSLDELDPDSRRTLAAALAEAGFVFRITRLEAVKEELEIRTWRVETQQGTRRFQTARDEWPRDVPGDGFLVRDVAGDLFWIPPMDELDDKSREILWALVD
jgi:hypothetical protein